MNKKNKKVVARRNAGLGDNLLATAHAWYYAQKTNRDLEICWAPSMYFKEKNKNAFGEFFLVPENIKNVRIIYNERIGFLERLKRRLPFFPKQFFLPSLTGEFLFKFLRQRTPKFFKNSRDKRRKWLINLIEKSEVRQEKEIVFNTHFNFLPPKKIKPFFDALKLVPKLQSRLDDFKNSHLQSKKVIGVHIRYYDKSLPFSNHTKYWLKPEKSFQNIKNRLNKITQKLATKDYIIFLATDNEIVYDFFSKNIGNVVTYNKSFQDVTFTLGMHHKVDENSFEDDLIEMFLLAECDVLYRYPPSGSWFSYYGSLNVDEVII